MSAMMRLALLLGLVVGCVNAACPPNFVASVTIPGKCYYLSTTPRNFFSAINYCRNLTYGADILAIANGFENSEVASLVQPQGLSDAWIGNAFYDNKSHWISTAAGSSNYSNWGSGTYNGNAASIYLSGSWSSANIGNYYGIICQIYPDDPTTFPPQITCPAGWTPSISVRGKCYRYIGVTDFFSATRGCLTTRIGDSHAELVTLTSQLEMMELYAAQSSYGPWTSLTSWEADGYWHWIETLHPTDYFGPYGPPSNSGETCAFLKNDNLYDIPCWNSQAAICQYFPYEPPAPTLPSLNCPQNGTASLTKPGTCYYLLSQRQSFPNARSACQELSNGFDYNDLFVPRTAAEYEEFEAILANQVPYTPVWLGLTSSNGNWGWISSQPSNITNIWCDGQPDTSQNLNHQCAFVISTKLDNNQFCWTAEDCKDSYAAICQSTNTFAACPPNFVASTVVPGKCYYIATTPTTFFSAINYCRNNLAYGADILSIANGFENNEVASLLQSRGISYAWAGNAFYDNEPHWIASAAGNSNYSNWGSGTYNGNAAFITSNGRWNSSNGAIAFVICQIYPDDPTTFPPPQIACPAGWTPSISVRGKCYQYIGRTADFFSATRNCLTTRIGDSHAELATLTSGFEMIELYSIQPFNQWISLTSWEADGYWRWIETLHPTDYFGPSGPPSPSGGTCSFLRSDNLYGAPCWNSQAAICQYFPYEPPAPTLPSLNCPQNSTASLTKPGTCYYVLSQYQDFQSARNACQTLNTGFKHSDLFVPRTATEYEEFEAILVDQVSQTPVWLGLTISNGNWGWISGRSNNITNIWCSGQPDTSQNPNDQCGFVISSSRDCNNNICWMAEDCRDSYTAVCQSTNTF